MSPQTPELAPADAASVFAALGDATRLALLSRLNDGSARSIVQLTDGTGLTRQGVSKHLRILEGAGIVKSERVGRKHLFVLDPAAIDGARHYLDFVCEQWDEALLRLRAFVEER